MNLKDRVLLGLATMLVVGAAACGGDDAGDSTPSASATVAGTIIRPAGSTAVPTLGTAPQVTPTPVLSPEEQAQSLKLVEAPTGMLEYVIDGPYVVPGDAVGAFLLDIETQEIEGWYDLLGDTRFHAFSGDNRFLVFERGEQRFLGGTIYPAGTYLADRESDRVYRWSGDAELVLQDQSNGNNDIASRNGVVLLRVPVEDGDDWFATYDLDAGEVVVTFRAEATWALFSEDGSQIALAGDDIYIAETASGSVERIDQQAFTNLDLEGRIELLNSDAGFLVTSNPAKDRFDGYWLHYTWDGDLLAQGTGKKVYPSPDGSLVAVADEIADDFDFLRLYTFDAQDTEDGAPSFRVVGVTNSYGFNAGNRWLADSAGLVVGLTPYGLTLAMQDGSFRPFVGVPSPDSADTFASNRVDSIAALDAVDEIIASVTFQGGVRDTANPWGDSGDELRIMIPHGGHGGPGMSASIIKPYVEQAPYESGPPALQISELGVAFGLLALYEEPGGTIVGNVPASYRVMAQEFALRCSGEETDGSEECPKLDSSVQAEFLALATGQEIGPEVALTGYWVRVITGDGQEGWLLVQVGRQGI